MKSILVTFIVLAFASSALSTPDDDIARAKQFFNSLVDQMNNDLTLIRGSLMKDKKHSEVPLVEVNRASLTVASRQSLMQSIDFVYHNTKYWVNDTFLNSNLENHFKKEDKTRVLKYVDELVTILGKIEKGTKGQDLVKNSLAKILKLSTEKVVRGSFNSFFDLVVKYEKYLKTEGKQLLSAINLVDLDITLDKSAEEEKKEADKWVLDLIGAMDRNLTKISNGLNKDHRYIAASTVRSTRFLVLSDSKPTLINANKLIFNNTKYWRNETLDISILSGTTNPLYVEVLNRMHKICELLSTIKAGLIKDGKTRLGIWVGLYRWAIENEVRPVFDLHFGHIENFAKYLKMKKQPSLLSSFSVESAMPLNVDSDDASTNSLKNLTSLFSKVNTNLAAVRNGLLKDRKFTEAPQVELARLVLQTATQQTVLQSVRFSFFNKKYWQTPQNLNLFAVSDVNNKARVLQVFNDLDVVLQKVENGTSTENKRLENNAAKVFRFAVQKEAKPTVQSYYTLVEKYSKYLPKV